MKQRINSTKSQRIIEKLKKEYSEIDKEAEKISNN